MYLGGNSSPFNIVPEKVERGGTTHNSIEYAKSTHLSLFFVLFCFVLFWFGLVWFGLVWFGLVWFGLVWFGLVWFGLFVLKSAPLA
jgi:hypothetical protein